MSDETEVMIGLETHVQLDTNTKLFCGCRNDETDKPNKYVCETCLGHPGSKPRFNEKVLDIGLKTAKALQCEVEDEIFFSRKTYFYPDMSKNYQITQYEVPLGSEGLLDIKIGDRDKAVEIQRLHIEEDPAKLSHEGGSISDSDYTLVDYNRAGTPLLEIVTKPVFSSPKEARAYLQELVKVLEYLGVYDSESHYAVKSDANISIDGGERVEVKNITGTKGIEQALSYEISRQKQLKRRNREVTQQTRSYNADQEITEALREKETEEAYGYIFDPDLTRQTITEDYRREVEQEIPELPHEKFERFKQEYGLADKLVEALITEQQMAADFEHLTAEYDPETIASWMTGELRKTLNYNEKSYTESELDLDWIKYIIGLISEDKISDRNAEKVLRKVIEEPQDPERIVEDQDLLKAEESEIGQFVEEVIKQNSDAVEDYESGEEGAINFLVGQVMQRSQGKADPKTAREKIIEELE